MLVASSKVVKQIQLVEDHLARRAVTVCSLHSAHCCQCRSCAAVDR